MSLLDRVRVIPRELKLDSRGWFLKVIDGREEHLPPITGEVYLTLAEPGQVRGNHYHRTISEWFTVVAGHAQLRLCDPGSGETAELSLDAASPQTVYIPAGLAHAFKNLETAERPVLLVAYADRPFDPDDTVAMNLL